MLTDSFGNRHDPVAKTLTNKDGEIYDYNYDESFDAFLLNDGRFAINGEWGLDRKVKFVLCANFKTMGYIDGFMKEIAPGVFHIIEDGEIVYRVGKAPCEDIDSFGNTISSVDRIVTNARDIVYDIDQCAESAMLTGDGIVAINGMWGTQPVVKFVRCVDFTTIGYLDGTIKRTNTGICIVKDCAITYKIGMDMMPTWYNENKVFLTNGQIIIICWVFFVAYLVLTLSQ